MVHGRPKAGHTAISHSQSDPEDTGPEPSLLTRPAKQIDDKVCEFCAPFSRPRTYFFFIPLPKTGRFLGGDHTGTAVAVEGQGEASDRRPIPQPKLSSECHFRWCNTLVVARHFATLEITSNPRGNQVRERERERTPAPLSSNLTEYWSPTSKQVQAAPHFLSHSQEAGSSIPDHHIGILVPAAGWVSCGLGTPAQFGYLQSILHVTVARSAHR